MAEFRLPALASVAAPKATEPLAAIQSAFARLAEEAVRLAAASQPQAAAKGEARSEGPVDLRKTVTDAVGAVLLETNLLDRLIEKHLKAAAPPAKSGLPNLGGPSPAGGPSGRNLRDLIQKELKAFIASESFKELMDEKFRAITLYLKAEVIPKVVRDALAKSEA